MQTKYKSVTAIIMFNKFVTIELNNCDNSSMNKKIMIDHSWALHKVDEPLY